MSLRDRIQTDLTASMRSGDSLRRDVLRMATNAAYNLEKRQGKPLTDDELLGVVTREVKTRRESVEAFRKGGREDLATKEESEIAILQEYLPQALSEEEIRSLVDEGIAATGATSARDMGKVMGWLSPRTRGRADGKRVSELVAQSLARTELANHDAATKPG
ncbi:MAG TPA: GatB/YqeY domain-containing protein [Candidatus Limnocylindrales bacterium]|nr:GatB/YqeY domain-containing protein [Candidatus Limnocylindrales bacterium]